MHDSVAGVEKESQVLNWSESASGYGEEGGKPGSQARDCIDIIAFLLSLSAFAPAQSGVTGYSGRKLCNVGQYQPPAE